MKLTELQIADLFVKYEQLLTPDPHIRPNETAFRREVLKNDRPDTGKLAATLLHLLVLETRPCRVLEFGAAVGYSTCAIALALRAQGKINSFVTYETNLKFKPKFDTMVERNGLQRFVECRWKDCKEIPEMVKEKGWEEQIDFVFVDCLHTEEFAEWYTSKIFPLLHPQAVICIHDIASQQSDPWSPILNSNQNPNGKDYGEHKAVQKWLVDNKIASTNMHAIFGGQDDFSFKLPKNQYLYDNLSATAEFDYNTDPRGVMLLVATNKSTPEEGYDQCVPKK
jgi:predicted O-methyltransferase YrrM